jgi:hypothetical protein
MTTEIPMPIDLTAFAAAVADSTAATAILAPRAARAARASGDRPRRVSYASRFLADMRRRFPNPNTPWELAAEADRWVEANSLRTATALTPEATLTSQIRTSADPRACTLPPGLVLITAEAAHAAGFANRTLMAFVDADVTGADVLAAMVAVRDSGAATRAAAAQAQAAADALADAAAIDAAAAADAADRAAADAGEGEVLS